MVDIVFSLRFRVLVVIEEEVRKLRREILNHGNVEEASMQTWRMDAARKATQDRLLYPAATMLLAQPSSFFEDGLWTMDNVQMTVITAKLPIRVTAPTHHVSSGHDCPVSVDERYQ